MADIFEATLSNGAKVQGESMSEVISKIAWLCDREDTLMAAAQKDASKLIDWQESCALGDTIAVSDGTYSWTVERVL